MKKQTLAVVLAFVTAMAFAQAKPILGILPFTGGAGEDGETIAALFSYQSELSRVFTIVSRMGSIEAVMKEQQFQRSSGLTDSDTIARLGRQYNADYVVAGHIQTLGDRKLVLITIIHVESLRQIAGAYKDYTDIEEVQNMIPEMAQRITAAYRNSGDRLPRLAVLPFAAPAGVDPGDTEVLAQILAVEIANSGLYTVLPRTSEIQTVMQEHTIQRSAVTEADNIKVIGKALTAQYVLAGNVRRLGRNNMFTAEIIDIETAGQLAGDFVNYQTMEDGLRLMADLGTKLTGRVAAEAELRQREAVQRQREAELRQREAEEQRRQEAKLQSINGGVLRASNTLVERLPPRSRLAIVYVTARDAEISESIVGDIEFIVRSKGFTLIDRNVLNRVRREQAFPVSGEVDDSRAITIGRIAGADVIITGTVTGTGELRRLRLRALNVRTGQVLSIVSERY
jgi:TolB-like protein